MYKFAYKALRLLSDNRQTQVLPFSQVQSFEDKSTILIKKKDQNQYTYSILHLCLLIIIMHIDKATSHQLLYENSISYVRSFSNTIIYDGNKDPCIYSSSIHLTKAHILKGAFYFLCDFEKQNNFFVYIGYALCIFIFPVCN